MKGIMFSLLYFHTRIVTLAVFHNNILTIRRKHRCHSILLFSLSLHVFPLSFGVIFYPQKGVLHSFLRELKLAENNQISSFPPVFFFPSLFPFSLPPFSFFLHLPPTP